MTRQGRPFLFTVIKVAGLGFLDSTFGASRQATLDTAGTEFVNMSADISATRVRL
ncbi:hypothetical protein [Desulfobacter hydrogenophilus]|uniref:hypothetical protein n=1 Tax=Desulfobacter hydrogenophilus TaxID=2291 RepID=UPI0013D2FB54|nr:hypothetical protein [Desulfobacter hydrogenophilus]NDY73638.1 hypothetical protein [Desulfobacter hydrogenophilus]